MKAGETHTVSFQLSASDLAFWHDAKVKKAEAGEFLVWVSTDSQTGTPVRFLYEE